MHDQFLTRAMASCSSSRSIRSERRSSEAEEQTLENEMNGLLYELGDEKNNGSACAHRATMHASLSRHSLTSSILISLRC